MSFSPGDRRQSGDSRLFFLSIRKPRPFQPAYAASLCSLVGKGLCEPMSLLARVCSCKPDSPSPTSPNYFVVSFAPLARSLCPAPAVVSSFIGASRLLFIGVTLRGKRSLRNALLFFVYAPPKLLSTCLRSNPLLVCGQMALRAYNDIGE